MKTQVLEFDERQELLSYTSDKRALVLCNEEKVYYPPMDEGESGMVSEGREAYSYDGLFVDIQKPDEKSVLESLKKIVMKAIAEYDKSDHVNSIFINGKHTWVDSAGREQISRRISTDEQNGYETTHLYDALNSVTYDLSINNAKNMLHEIETYAIKCFDITNEHISRVQSIDNIQELMEYDHTANYPEKLSFIV